MRWLGLVLGLLLLSACVEQQQRDYNQLRWRYVQGDSVTALREMQALAQQNMPDAQFFLAMLAYVDKDPQISAEQAVSWLRQAAAQQHLGARYYLAEFYYKGYGVKTDRVHALQLMQTLGEQGYVPALWRVSQYLAPDAQALSWCERAAKAGHRQAQQQLVEVYQLGLWGQAGNSERAAFWQAQLQRRRF